MIPAVHRRVSMVYNRNLMSFQTRRMSIRPSPGDEPKSMRRIVDLTIIHPKHELTHIHLLNWARWCMGGTRNTDVLPMFREYRSGYQELRHGGIPIDTLAALEVQRSYTLLPEKHRWVLNWYYCRPFIPVLKLRKALGLTTPALEALLHEGRSMLKNNLHNINK